MERLEFNDYEDFACEVADTFDDICYDDDFNDIAIIAHYDEAKQIIREILCLGYDLNSIKLNNPELGYDDVPYIISVCGIESEYEVWCEPMVRNNGEYIDDESSIIYVLDNCSSEVLRHLDSECIFEVGIGDDDCSCDDCEECLTINGKPATKEEFDAYVKKIKKNDSKCKCDKCVEYSKDDDGDIHGFTASKSDGDGYVCYSFYTSENLMKNDIEDILKLF